MALRHGVYDTDTHFIINPVTRTIRNEGSAKTTLIQGDHNSEIFSFEISSVEGHNMSKCNKVEIHYTNLATNKTDKSEDIYEVKDLQESKDVDGTVIFSWLISKNATKYDGSLSFSITFKCLNGEIIEYEWSTGTFNNISIGKRINNSETIVEEYSDSVEAWKLDTEEELKVYCDELIGTTLDALHEGGIE